MSNATERIKGYCTEVNKDQWEELVRVADEVGVYLSGKDFSDVYPFFALTHESDRLVGFTGPKGKQIQFPDFLAKLRGEEEWRPKAGEMVEVGNGYVREYIDCRGGLHWCWNYDGQRACSWPSVSPIRPTITRAEAEQKLGKRIID